jgi:hypothetical protein
MHVSLWKLRMHLCANKWIFTRKSHSSPPWMTFIQSDSSVRYVWFYPFPLKIILKRMWKHIFTRNLDSGIDYNTSKESFSIACYKMVISNDFCNLGSIT